MLLYKPHVHLESKRGRGKLLVTTIGNENTVGWILLDKNYLDSNGSVPGDQSAAPCGKELQIIWSYP